jgi:ABC-type branched-subunit amino acid transport system substrate-binding protein
MAGFLIQQLHAQEPAVVSLDVNVTDQSYDGVVQGIQKAGKQVCDAQKVSATQTSFDSVVQTEMQQGCDGVVLNLDPAHTLDWLSSAQRAGYSPQRVGLTAFDQTVIEGSGSAGEGLVTYFGSLLPSADSGSPAVRQFLQALHAYHPDERNVNLAAVGYLAGISFAEAVSKVHGELTRESLAGALESQAIDNGFQPPVQFQSGNHVAATSCRFYQLHAGRYQPISGWYGG